MPDGGRAPKELPPLNQLASDERTVLFIAAGDEGLFANGAFGDPLIGSEHRFELLEYKFVEFVVEAAGRRWQPAGAHFALRRSGDACDCRAARSAGWRRAPRRLARQLVGFFVARVAGVSAHPLETHIMAGDLGVELLPQVQ